MKGQAEDAALELGLSSAAEYFRIALDHLVHQRQLPAEFVGKRRIAKRGRPVVLPRQQEAA